MSVPDVGRKPLKRLWWLGDASATGLKSGVKECGVDSPLVHLN